ncbi:MAG: hypothetical protein E5V24_31775, partial [Mesorhizobium sp.]
MARGNGGADHPRRRLDQSRGSAAPRSVTFSGEAIGGSFLNSPDAPFGHWTCFDDTLDVEHGHQQLSLVNAHYDERCFL